MAIIFDGRAFASQKIEKLERTVADLKSKGKTPRLASILIGEDPASKLYVGLKKKAAEKIGAELDPYFLPEKTKLTDILSLIVSLNEDDNVNGIMVQLPIPGELSSNKDKIVDSIKPEKDIDGLKDNSHFLHPTSKAVVDILHKAEDGLSLSFKGGEHKVAVVGSRGMVGKPLVKELRSEGYEVLEANRETSELGEITKKADVIIGASGVPGIITPDILQEGVVVIDVGSPKGDFDPEVETKAAFFTPVPGGVGPVTISCLLENLISSC
jgi:methylenetetrahydrofolate dehydrogenase (NADP+)/methenyltetrahydrofolate cyclohydrolase